MAKRPRQADDASRRGGERVRAKAPRAKQAAQESIITAKDAVLAAGRYFAEITGISSGVTVDEVELQETEARGKYWMVTLGYVDTSGPIPFSLERKKVYKALKVDARTGKVLSMKIRDI